MTNNTDTQATTYRVYEVTRRDGSTYQTPFFGDALLTGLPYKRVDLTQNEYFQKFDI